MVECASSIETWNERTARLFACHCAEDALQYTDKGSRPTLECAIYVARCYADGAASDKELDAAWDAAWDAARAAAGDAAWAAAWAAARAAARDAAGAAAWAVLKSTTEHLQKSALSLVERMIDAK